MQNADILLDPARAFLVQAGAYLPRIGLALLMLIVGWIAAKLVRFAVEKGLRAINFGVLTERSGMDTFLQQGGSKSDTTRLFGLLAFWLVMFAALVIAFNSLGLASLVKMLIFIGFLLVGLAYAWKKGALSWE